MGEGPDTALFPWARFDDAAWGLDVNDQQTATCVALEPTEALLADFERWQAAREEGAALSLECITHPPLEEQEVLVEGDCWSSHGERPALNCRHHVNRIPE